MTLPRRTEDHLVREMAARHQMTGSSDELADEMITRGNEAAERLLTGNAWQDWVTVGRAVAVGRVDAMRRAHTNEPSGQGYNVAMGDWLKHHPMLEQVVADRGNRARLLDLIDHLDKVEAWRKQLPTKKRLTLNYPKTVYAHWKKATSGSDSNKQTPPSSVTKLKEAVAMLSDENRRLKDANGGNLFTPQDRPVDVVRVLISTFSARKLTEIRRLLGEKIK
jgi:hypothetical protein